MVHRELSSGPWNPIVPEFNTRYLVTSRNHALFWPARKSGITTQELFHDWQVRMGILILHEPRTDSRIQMTRIHFHEPNLEKPISANRYLLTAFVGSIVAIISSFVFAFQKIRPWLGQLESLSFWILYLMLGFFLCSLFIVVSGHVRERRVGVPLFILACSVAFLATLQTYPQANESSVVGWDSYYTARLSTDIASWGHIQQSSYSPSSTHFFDIQWPGFSLLCAQSAIVSGSTVLDMSRFFPTIVSVSSLFIFWGLIRKLHPGATTMPIGIFALVFLFGSHVFHSWMVKETLGFPLFLLGLYSAFAYLHDARITWSCVFVVCMTSITLSHDLSTFCLVLAVMFVSISSTIFKSKPDGNHRLLSSRRAYILFLLGLAIWIGHSMLVGMSMSGQIAGILLSIVSPSSTVSQFAGTESEWNRRVLAVVVLTAVIAIYLIIQITSKLRQSKSSNSTWDLSVLALGASLFVIVLMFTRFLKSSFLPNYDRFLTFPWPFVYQSGLETQGGHASFRTYAFVSILFCLLGVVAINPYVYSERFAQVQDEQTLLNSEGVFETLSSFPLKGVVECGNSTIQIVNGWLLIDASQMPPFPNPNLVGDLPVDYLIFQGSHSDKRVLHSSDFSAVPILDVYDRWTNVSLILDSGLVVIYGKV